FDGQYYPHGVKPWSPPTERAASAREAPRVCGAGMLIRLEAVRRDGAFDERFFCYLEESDWCRRLVSRDWRFAAADPSVVLHQHGGSDVGGNQLYFRARNQFLLEENAQGATIRSRLMALDHGLPEAEAARRDGRDGDWVAIACGLRDGW